MFHLGGCSSIRCICAAKEIEKFEPPNAPKTWPASQLWEVECVSEHLLLYIKWFYYYIQMYVLVYVLYCTVCMWIYVYVFMCCMHTYICAVCVYVQCAVGIDLDCIILLELESDLPPVRTLVSVQMWTTWNESWKHKTRCICKCVLKSGKSPSKFISPIVNRNELLGVCNDKKSTISCHQSRQIPREKNTVCTRLCEPTAVAIFMYMFHNYNATTAYIYTFNAIAVFTNEIYVASMIQSLLLCFSHALRLTIPV